MKKLIIKYIPLFFILFACSDFDELNQNPNEPTNVTSGVLLTNAIRKSIETTSNESFLIANNVAQLTAKKLRIEVDNYLWNAFPTLWSGLYESLSDVESALLIAEKSNDDTMKGVLLILKSWIYSQLTNAYGDIPYTEAIKGGLLINPNYTPKYDSQETIYRALLNDLEKAGDLLANQERTVNGDILYNGDTKKWLKFSNVLRLRLLMYMSNKEQVATQFKKIVDNKLLFESNDDQAALMFLNTLPNKFPTLPLKSGDFTAVGLSKSSKNILSSYNDPRLSRYARPDNHDYANPVFSGIQNGSPSDDGSLLGLPYYDLNDDVKASDLGIEYAKGLLMTYAEQEFLLAEAAYNGWISHHAENHYKNGIKASHDYYQVDYISFGYSNFDDFYSNSGVALDEKMDIWEQKWLALFFTAMDPYFEVRRMYHNAGGFGGLRFLNEPSGINYNEKKLPMRFLYPFQEQSLNQVNYEETKSKYDGINGKMWILTD